MGRKPVDLEAEGIVVLLNTIAIKVRVGMLHLDNAHVAHSSGNIQQQRLELVLIVRVDLFDQIVRVDLSDHRSTQEAHGD